MGLKIFVSEEYGYRSWIWDYPHDAAQLIKDWKAGRAPLDYFDPRNSDFDGDLTQLHSPLSQNDSALSAYIHTHDPEDTILVINGQQIPQDPDKYNAGPVIWPK